MNEGISIFVNTLPKLVHYIPVTLYLLIVPSVVSWIIGGIICYIRLKKKNVLYQIVSLFVSFFRGTPSLVQLYLILYGLPKLLSIFGVDINRWQSITFFLIATICNFSSFVSEAFRSAYMALDKQQIEAGISVGFNKIQCFIHIILPQIMRIALPNLKNLEIDLLKGTALAYTIGVIDVLGQANTISALKMGYGRLWILGAAAVIYFIINVLIEYIFSLLTKHFSRWEVQR